MFIESRREFWEKREKVKRDVNKQLQITPEKWKNILEKETLEHPVKAAELLNDQKSLLIKSLKDVKLKFQMKEQQELQ